MDRTDTRSAESRENLNDARVAADTSVDGAFNQWLTARTAFRPPVSQLPEQLQQELRDQFLSDHTWHERPRCSQCKQFIERRTADRRQVLTDAGSLGRRFNRDRRRR